MQSIQVSIVMGSLSDWSIMQYATQIMDDFFIPYEKQVISAHRTPELMLEYAKNAQDRGIKVIIAAAGGAAHLPGMIASRTILPVIGVPIKSTDLNGLDSLLSIVQMPKGVPVATVAIGKSGAINAALLAIQIIALNDSAISTKLLAYKAKMIQDVEEMNKELLKNIN